MSWLEDTSREPYLFLWFKDVTSKHIALSISCYVTEDFQILRVVRYVENPVNNKTKRKVIQKHIKPCVRNQQQLHLIKQIKT